MKESWAERDILRDEALGKGMRKTHLSWMRRMEDLKGPVEGKKWIPTWRGSRGSCGSLWGSRAVVILHLKAHMRYSDPPQHHAAWPHPPFSLTSGPGTHRFVGGLLRVILWIGLAKVRNFRINHTESAKKKMEALDSSTGSQTSPARRCGLRRLCCFHVNPNFPTSGS